MRDVRGGARARARSIRAASMQTYAIDGTRALCAVRALCELLAVLNNQPATGGLNPVRYRNKTDRHGGAQQAYKSATASQQASQGRPSFARPDQPGLDRKSGVLCHTSKCMTPTRQTGPRRPSAPSAPLSPNARPPCPWTSRAPPTNRSRGSFADLVDERSHDAASNARVQQASAPPSTARWLAGAASRSGNQHPGP